MSERYVVLGLAVARADWFRTIGQWATAAMLPAEFLRCVSVEELRARLRSGRAFSAAVVDGSLPTVDRDLIALAAEQSVAVLVVDDEARRDWRALGAAAVLASQFSRDELLEVLAATSTPVGSAAYDDAVPAGPDSPGRGRLVAVTGPGGTGASTLAIALAQGLAGADVPWDATRGLRSDDAAGDAFAGPPAIILADLCRYADQAMLHDARVVVPSIQEVVEAHRTAVPASASLRDQTFEVPARGYRLLLGLRRPRHWVALRPHALARSMESLCAIGDVLVADIECDVEGEAETGSSDVEDRNAMARTALERADVVVVVGEPSMKGLFASVRVINELVGFGVGVERLLPVVNRAPRSPRVRAELTQALGELVMASLGAVARDLVSPSFVPVRPVGDALRDGVALPDGMARLLARGVLALLDRVPPRGSADGPEGRRLQPGSLPTFSSQERP